MVMKNEKKVCPSCGGEDVLTRVNVSSREVVVQCHSCGLRISKPCVGLSVVDLSFELERYWRKIEGTPEMKLDRIDIYDSVETHTGCTVQILTNTSTGETSVGWYREEASKDED